MADNIITNSGSIRIDPSIFNAKGLSLLDERLDIQNKFKENPQGAYNAIDDLILNSGREYTGSYYPDQQLTTVDQQNMQQQEKSNLLTTQQASRGTIGSNGPNKSTLVSTLSGSDLSVFFLTEIFKQDDVSKYPDSPNLWGKDILLLELDSVMSFTYSIVREVFPVRSIGTAKPKSYTRGPVGIAGSLCFSVFTEDVLVRLRTQMQESIQKLKASLKNSTNINYQQYLDALNAAEVYMLNQLAPFNLLVMGTNELGSFSKMMLKGVRIIDENQMQGIQQPNIINKVTFSAEDIFPLMSGSYSADTMDFSKVASKDQNSPISSNPYATYNGSQLMRDILAMDSKTYKLK